MAYEIKSDGAGEFTLFCDGEAVYSAGTRFEIAHWMEKQGIKHENN